MEQNKKTAEPDNTAVRTALWRALHVQVDAQPHILEDGIGFRLIAPDDSWRQRPDMDTEFTKRVRVSTVTRERFIEDLIIEQTKLGITRVCHSRCRIGYFCSTQNRHCFQTSDI